MREIVSRTALLVSLEANREAMRLAAVRANAVLAAWRDGAGMPLQEGSGWRPARWDRSVWILNLQCSKCRRGGENIGFAHKPEEFSTTTCRNLRGIVWGERAKNPRCPHLRRMLFPLPPEVEALIPLLILEAGGAV